MAADGVLIGYRVKLTCETSGNPIRIYSALAREFSDRRDLGMGRALDSAKGTFATMKKAFPHDIVELIELREVIQTVEGDTIETTGE